MYCLWNEEYGEHDLTHIGGLEDILKRQAESYEKYRGIVVGDYKVLDVEYDWGRRDQRWKIQCNLCGKESYQYHTADWRRGKGRKITCNCRKEKEKAEKEAKKKVEKEKILQNQKEHLHKVYGEWEVIEYNGYSKCKIKCIKCEKIKTDIKIENVINQKIPQCNHKKPTDYSGDEWIGKKEGHLTTIGKDGMMFIAKCDCGEIIRVRPTDLFTSKRITTCNSPNCIYASKAQQESRTKQKKGFMFEKSTTWLLENLGYTVSKTQDNSDFGVDIIITENDDSKIAVQCKLQITPAGVEAIQEVYAGGIYYDCTKFAVISPSGFSNPAIIMAKKLGVYLCKENHKFHYPEDINEYAATLLPIKFNNAKLEKLYEIDGEKHTLSDWCLIYNISDNTVRKRLKAGITLKTALETPCKNTRGKIYTVHNYTGNIADICRHFNVSEPYVRYRMTTNKMSLEDAIFQPKKAIGRPKKSEHSKEDDKQIIIQGF